MLGSKHFTECKKAILSSGKLEIEDKKLKKFILYKYGVDAIYFIHDVIDRNVLSLGIVLKTTKDYNKVHEDSALTVENISNAIINEFYFIMYQSCMPMIGKTADWNVYYIDFESEFKLEVLEETIK